MFSVLQCIISEIFILYYYISHRFTTGSKVPFSLIAHLVVICGTITAQLLLVCYLDLLFNNKITDGEQYGFQAYFLSQTKSFSRIWTEQEDVYKQFVVHISQVGKKSSRIPSVNFLNQWHTRKQFMSRSDVYQRLINFPTIKLWNKSYSFNAIIFVSVPFPYSSHSSIFPINIT